MNGPIGPLAQRKQIDLTIDGKRVTVRAWVAGCFAARATTWGWCVHRVSDIGSTELVAGLDRGVAIKVAQDMCALDIEIAGGPALEDFQAVLRKYLGIFAL